ncbi:SSI family serine proteinase inhibitor [Streptomyces sp. NPDC006739]|uniref:SSI family serine proteinase inhibitor n=1 Tax=Streptomyces sp. NPDC006739 TaxID=3364763 RepID=UPI0036AA9537
MQYAGDAPPCDAPHRTPRASRQTFPVTALATVPTTAAATPLTAAPVPAPARAAAVPVTTPPPVRDGDHLTVVVQHAGGGKDGTYELSCHPGGGHHPDVEGACQAVDRNVRWGRDAFAPVAPGSECTMIYGGPATAHVTGTWAGRPVEATYDRSNGCQIGRWDRMVPLLPTFAARTT